MGTKLMQGFITVLILAGTLFAGTPESGYLFKHGNTQFGGYIATTGKMTSVFSETAVFGDLKAALTVNRKWAIGVTGSGMHFDNPTPALIDDGTYGLQVSYGGMFLERMIPMNAHMMLNLTLMTGQGTATYQYDRDYRKEKVWSEEIVDVARFGIQELSLEVQRQLPRNFWIGVYGSYRHTSPL